MTYMIENGLGTNARNLALQTPQARASRSYRNDFIYDLHLGPKKLQKQVDPEQKQTSLEYVPDVSEFVFKFRGQRMTFSRRASAPAEVFGEAGKIRLVEQADSGTIVISCVNLTGNAQPIKDFLKFVQDTTDKATESMTMIFRPEYSAQTGSISWDEGVARPARDLAAVTLDSHVKDPLVRDIESYLSEATKKFYVSRNIPWRRGYLFYGPPGTGKTSMAMAMAGQYGLNLYLLSMTQPGISNQALENLFEALPNRCIVLLEDIDSAGIKRENMRDTHALLKPLKKKRKDPHFPYENHYECFDADGNPIDNPPIVKNQVTLSTLLNILDGVHAPEGRVIIMTSNNPDSLDRALLRPGRIDRKVLFDYASREVCTKLYTRVFDKSTHEEDVASLAKQFAEKIPGNAITPAEVQGHLLQNISSGKAALENVDKFVADILAEKQKGIFHMEAAAQDNRNENYEPDSAKAEAEEEEGGGGGGEVESHTVQSKAKVKIKPGTFKVSPSPHKMLNRGIMSATPGILEETHIFDARRTRRSKNQTKHVFAPLVTCKRKSKKFSGEKIHHSDEIEAANNAHGVSGAAIASALANGKGIGTSESGNSSGTVSPACSVTGDESSQDLSTPPSSASEKEFERGSEKGNVSVNFTSMEAYV
ncbi:MAG: hypothetical protein FE78DRAFT_86415 [Acidomyces sp. 'richmondensis']|nr:MAG: hypothetical protein FE78DRAFT_86415 [Acidomyces sp. 'richmondensis']